MKRTIDSIIEEFSHVTHPDCVDLLEKFKELDLSPSFEAAEAIVKARMIEEESKLKEERGDTYLSLSTGYRCPSWCCYPSGVHNGGRVDGDTLAECLAKIPPVKSKAEIRQEEIAKLEARLAELKSQDLPT